MSFAWTDLAAWTPGDVMNLAATLLALTGVVSLPVWLQRQRSLNRLAETAERRAGQEHQERIDANARAQEALLAPMFARAVEQLGQDQPVVRAASIFTLEHVARLMPGLRWPVVEILSAFLREAAPWSPESGTADPQAPRQDVQAALTVLARRDTSAEGEEQVLDLRGTDLRLCAIRGGQFERANFSGANLENAALAGVNFRGAFLWGTRLGRARLSQVNFQDAKLFKADLKGANLAACNLAGADLAGAALEGAKLGGANGLTGSQLASAATDDATELPAYLKVS